MGPQSVDGWLASLAANQLGSFEQLLDVASRELVVDDRRVPLTRREFQTMAHLVERSGAIVSRDDLIAGIWGTESDVISNVVDTTIRSLRKKLAHRSNVIETVSGIGYRFRDS
jgi:DNA-binding response OmpR family regulator